MASAIASATPLMRNVMPGKTSRRYKVGEWSEYFEDFPEENPANWINGCFNPGLKAELNRIDARNKEVQRKLRKANAEQYRWSLINGS